MLPRIVTVLLCIVGLTTSANAADGAPVSEGLLDFKIPSTGESGKTWYRIIGKLEPGVRPLIALHGGPGVNSGYLEALAPVTKGRPGPLIVYDQIGNGNSTHYPKTIGDTTFWTERLFFAQLESVLAGLRITEYDLIGHSWGAMLAAMHAAQRTWISQLPPPIRDVLIKGEETGETDTKEYENAVNYFISQHFCRLHPFPPSLLEAFATLSKDPTVCLTMNGNSGFTITGSLKDWTVIPDLPKITAPTLVTNGRYDQTADIAVEPFVQKIPNVKWVRFENSSNTALFEEPEKYRSVLEEFLYK
ncbi:hypothetical protein EST38_g5147 [Candolleomyces aberdarensis]|uniref:AB hydrolase-1 domain-containing protein n=1 Tax=Candolleomyces aberdarensis TaxID=2316362 RepID=A0A4V1Q434_9AGAR|nr:hypothetical protein EST38_g5147 [Candolleomyces aberdarensis]